MVLVGHELPPKPSKSGAITLSKRSMNSIRKKRIERRRVVVEWREVVEYVNPKLARGLMSLR